MSDAATLVIRNIGQLATCDLRRGTPPGVIERAAVAAAGETLIYVGPEAGLRDEIELAPECGEMDARGHAAVPGFVDSHTHMVWLGDRAADYAIRATGDSYAVIAQKGGGIRDTVAATQAGSLDELACAAHERARRMLRNGTTTVEVKSGYGMTHDAELRQLEAAESLYGASDVPDIVTTYLPLHAVPDKDREGFIESVLREGLPRAAAHAEFADAFCETGAYSVDECRRFFSAARTCGLGLKLHTEQLTRTGGTQLAAQFHATSADHLEHAGDNDLRALARAGVVGVLLPGASLTLGGPPPPGRRLQDAGATVAIATDCNPGTSYTESMPLMTSLAVALAGLTPAEALMAACRGGAMALRRADRGILAVGMRCDLVVLRDRHWLDVAYHLGGDVVASVVRGGHMPNG